MITICFNFGCGCCTGSAHFENVEAAEKAFAAAGLGSSVTIVDSTGALIEIVDTFYGFWLEDEEKRGLDYLVDQVLDIAKGDD